MEKILEIGMEGGSHNIYRTEAGKFIYSTQEFIDLDEFPELADYVPTPPEILENFEIAFNKITDRFHYWPKLYFVFLKLEFHQYIENQLIKYLSNLNIVNNDDVTSRLYNWENIFGKEIKNVNGLWVTNKVAEPKESIF